MAAPMNRTAVERLTTFIAELVSETNNLSLHDMLSLAGDSRVVA